MVEGDVTGAVDVGVVFDVLDETLRLGGELAGVTVGTVAQYDDTHGDNTVGHECADGHHVD